MRSTIREKFSQTHITRLFKAGYEWHCIENGELCFHRTIDTYLSFPRFHLFVHIYPEEFEISIHWDQFSLSHKSNHGASWAYEGRKVQEELHRVIKFLNEKNGLKKVNHMNLGFVPAFMRNHRLRPKKKERSKKPWNWKPIVRK